MGKVYLIGAGPGDPELLTLKGQRILSQADIILYDRLVNPLLLYWAPKTARLVYVGKAPRQSSWQQNKIMQQLVAYAAQYETVVRLKGGDPGIFGRVGEETAVLRQHQVAYELIPGITSGTAAALYSGFELTKRLVSEKCLVCTPTAKLQQFKTEPLAQIAATGCVVIYMGMKQLPTIRAIFLEQGSPETLPVAIIQWATWGKQRKVVGTLATILDQVKRHQLTHPGLIIVGQSVTTAKLASWFENLPQFGRSLVYVSDQPLSMPVMLQYTAQGCDFYPVFVGAAYDPRFDDLHQRLLPDYLQAEIKCTSPAAAAGFKRFKNKLGILK